jgi:hypothetical protein
MSLLLALDLIPTVINDIRRQVPFRNTETQRLDVTAGELDRHIALLNDLTNFNFRQITVD